MKYTRFVIATGLITEYGQRPLRSQRTLASGATLAECLGLVLAEGEGLIEGEWSDAAWRIVDGRPVPFTPPAAPATVALVNAECARRIEAVYPLWQQLNILRDGGDAVMDAFIDACRAASNKLTAIDPIPADYRDDRHWPATPTETTNG